MNEHYIEKCRVCKTVISQCRCPGPKEERWSVCDKCPIPEGQTIDSDQQLADEAKMTDYNDKAQRIVALGIGKHEHFSEGHRDAGDWYGYDYPGDTAEYFCNDWRVVGALILAAAQEGLDVLPNPGDIEAIVDACLEALEND